MPRSSSPSLTWRWLSCSLKACADQRQRCENFPQTLNKNPTTYRWVGSQMDTVGLRVGNLRQRRSRPPPPAALGLADEYKRTAEERTEKKGQQKADSRRPGKQTALCKCKEKHRTLLATQSGRVSAPAQHAGPTTQRRTCGPDPFTYSSTHQDKKRKVPHSGVADALKLNGPPKSYYPLMSSTQKGIAD